jgi:hypothetical protein
MNRFWLFRGAALGAGMLLLVGVLFPTTAGETSAEWIDTQSTAAELRAAKLPAAQGIKCTTNPGLINLFPAAELSWPPADSVGGSTVSYKIVGKAAPSDTDWIVVKSLGSTEFKFNADLVTILEGTLGLLFGNDGEAIIGVVVVHSFAGSIWESEPSETKEVIKAGLLLNAGFKCG